MSLLSLLSLLSPTGERVPFSMFKERNEERDEKIEQARAMREEGKSYRQIAEELGYKTPSAVHKLLKQEE